ncbi:MAG: HNH endonuclease signature motif containing protein [Anaerolineae bacterium]|nr:HNH endonuclease signature motif containing protein [Anaerolineae bacterium]
MKDRDRTAPTRRHQGFIKFDPIEGTERAPLKRRSVQWVEHIKPRGQSGKTSIDNLALACQGCNSHKYTKTKSHDPVSGTPVKLYHPRQQRWEDRFRWSDDFRLMVGVTAIGRATIEALQLNRAGLVNLRQVL